MARNHVRDTASTSPTRYKDCMKAMPQASAGRKKANIMHIFIYYYICPAK
jgi:hypothetical protein